MLMGEVFSCIKEISQIPFDFISDAILPDCLLASICNKAKKKVMDYW